jgi:hypothetical protein
LGNCWKVEFSAENSGTINGSVPCLREGTYRMRQGGALFARVSIIFVPMKIIKNGTNITPPLFEYIRVVKNSHSADNVVPI